MVKKLTKNGFMASFVVFCLVHHAFRYTEILATLKLSNKTSFFSKKMDYW